MSAFFIVSVITAYFLVLMLVAWLTGRDSSNDAFFIGNRQSPWYLVAYGMIGASLSGVTFISVPGVVGNFESINGHFSYMQVVLGYLLGYFVIATVLMPLYYRLQLTSIYTYLEQRLGTASYKTGAFFFLLSRTIGASFRLFLVAMVLQLFVFDQWGVPFVVNVMITLLLIGLYTIRGGIRTIVWTDTLQTTFMLLSVAAAVIYIASSLGLDFTSLISKVYNSKYSTTFFWDHTEDRFFFKQFLSGAFIAIVMTGLDQDMMQKNNSCRSIGDAQKNMFWFSIVLVIVNLLFVSLGALLYIFAAENGIALPERTDQLFPTLALEHFSPIIGVLFLIGLVAAAFSSADSAITALTTSVCVDFLGFEKKEVTGKSEKYMRFYVHIGFAILILCVILVFRYLLSEDVISALFRIAGYTYGPLLGLFFYGLFTNWQVRDRWVPLVCIVAPVLSYIINLYSEELLWGYKFGFELLILNGLLTFAGLIMIRKVNGRK